MRNRFPFTDARVKVLPAAAEGQRDVYYDTKQPGLTVRVTANGVKTFCVHRRIRGSRLVRENIGRSPDITVEDARAKAAVVVAQIATAKDPGAARRALRVELTLGQLFQRYLEDREKAGKRRTSDMQSMWQLYLGTMPDEPRKSHGRIRVKPGFGVDWSTRKISAITAEQVSALHARIVNAGKPTTANRVHELLRAVYGYAVKSGLVKLNPADAVTPAKEVDRSRFLGKDEFPRFQAALKKEPPLWRDYFTVLLYVGYRRRAVAAMRWVDLDLPARGDVGSWSVPGEHAKNGDPIVLPLVGDALITLRRRARERDASGWVFPGGSGAGHITQPKKSWSRILTNAELKDLRIHDLRRTLGSWLAMSGVSLPIIGHALGHKDPRSTQVYARFQTAPVAAAVIGAHKAMRAAARKVSKAE